MYKEPYIIHLEAIGEWRTGYLTSIENFNQTDFPIQRVYWIYGIPVDLERGGHAHKQKEQIVVALNGQLSVELLSLEGNKSTFLLKKPNEALYIPPNYWRTIHYAQDSILIAMASTLYEKSDYLLDFEDFKKYWSGMGSELPS